MAYFQVWKASTYRAHDVLRRVYQQPFDQRVGFAGGEFDDNKIQNQDVYLINKRRAYPVAV